MNDLNVSNSIEVVENEVVFANLQNVSTSKKTVIQRTNNFDHLIYEVETVETTAHRCISNQRFVTFVYPDNIKTQVNTCSDVYKLVHNEDIFGKARNILTEKGFVFTEEYEIINYSRFYGTFKIEGHNFEIGNGDVIKPLLKIQHSYCGTTKYKINFGYFRMICSNGMTIPVDEMSDFNCSIIGKHTEKINESLEELFNTIDFFVNNIEAHTKSFVMLQNFVINNPKERIEEVLKASGIVNIDNKKFNTVNFILDRINLELDALNLDSVSDWLIYNGINYYIFNEYSPMAAPEKKEEIDGKVLSFIIQTCKARQIETETDEIIETLFEG